MITNIGISFDGPKQYVTNLYLSWNDLDKYFVYMYSLDSDGRLIQGFSLPHEAMEELARGYLRKRGYRVKRRSNRKLNKTAAASTGVKGEP